MDQRLAVRRFEIQRFAVAPGRGSAVAVGVVDESQKMECVG